ncbi:hypothetical protein HDU82_000501 [Entophlyctis luteolus]|nr:hypothetical protein HDU82_000501 [Entophlyctis luteolus]
MSRAIRLVTFDAFNCLFRIDPPVNVVYTRFLSDVCGWPMHETPTVTLEHFLRAYKVVNSQLPLFAKDAGGYRLWWEQVITNTFRHAGIQRQDISPRLVNVLVSHFETADAVNLDPAARLMLQSIKSRKAIVGVISNSDPRTRSILKSLGLFDVPNAPIDFVITSYDVGAEKPDRRIFNATLQMANRLPNCTPAIVSNEALHVGDDAERDYAGARRAGWRAVQVQTGLGAVQEAIEAESGW